MLAFVQVLLSGVAIGCVYGLVALSFVLIFKSTGTFSFMQGELLMLGAFVALALHRLLDFPLLLAAVLAVLAVGGLGALCERLALRRTLGQPPMQAVMLTFGLGLMVHGAVAAVPAATQEMYRLPFAADSVQLGAWVLPAGQLWVVVATAVLMLALAAFFRFSRTGLALRACAESMPLAALMGVPVTAMHSLAWALAAGLAAIAGLLLAPITFIHLGMGEIALKAFPAAVLGGLTSLPGAVVGGLCLGLIEALAGLVLAEGAKDMVPYLLLLVALLWFPQGLLGQAGARGRG